MEPLLEIKAQIAEIKDKLDYAKYCNNQYNIIYLQNELTNLETLQENDIKYSKEYFIEKFKAIPATEIGVSSINNKCALWHCGVRDVDGYYVLTHEAMALIKLFGGKDFKDYCAVYNVNDFNLKIKTPKDRILAKLESL